MLSRMHDRRSEGHRVAIVQGWVRQYRRPFFEQLRERLAARDIELVLVHGTPRGVHGRRGDTVSLDWAIHVEQRELHLGPYHLDWQPCVDAVRDVDLVILEQATRRLLNYVLIARQAIGGPPVAFWGHGRNFQAVTPVQRGAEVVKQAISRHSHWFFAYNDLSVDVLHRMGYPANRVTSVGNAIDMAALADARDRVTEADREELRAALGIRGRHVGIYCGAMYAEKRLPFLIDAAAQVRRHVPDFELVCVGGGVQEDLIRAAAGQHRWIHHLGPTFGDDVARAFSLAGVLLMPGLVGLAVLDSFAFEVPLVTTADALHSPEIGYLQDGSNGVVVPGDGAGGAYADAVVRVLLDPDWRAHLIRGCRASAPVHSVEAMADRFATGVVDALHAAPRGLARGARAGGGCRGPAHSQ